MNKFEYIKEHIKESTDAKQKLYASDEVIKSIEKVSNLMIEMYKNGGKLLIAGNGGSAADSQHIAGEMVSRFYFDRPGLPAMALTTDTSIITAIGNDYGYERLFARQIQANGNGGDVFIGITTSGNSPNIVEAFKECKARGVLAVGLTGEKGGEIEKYTDICIKVPSTSTPRIQEMHILVGHIICAVVEEQIFGKEK